MISAALRCRVPAAFAFAALRFPFLFGIVVNAKVLSMAKELQTIRREHDMRI
jgi:hypothetical protein